MQRLPESRSLERHSLNFPGLLKQLKRFTSMVTRQIVFYNKLKSVKDFVFKQILNLLIVRPATPVRPNFIKSNSHYLNVKLLNYILFYSPE
ncbi:hypothetical protein AR546_11550 [Leptospira interrogans serovar Canicola]|nr:hypothetical protein AR546_11550 [Leptospira interrogans serovar Canicola]OMH63261.1 hypothetical protein BW243_14415 [Leptospira interrogans serovar Pomona]POR19036.1 hypothetical protein B0T34_07190 [Leptospira interrogans serovar Canicola]